MQTPGNRLRVGMVSSSRIVRDYFAHTMTQNIYLAWSIADANALAPHYSAEIVLVDAPDFQYSIVRGLQRNNTAVKLIIIEADHDGLDLTACAYLGVCGFTLKEAGAERIAETIQMVSINRLVIPPQIAERLYEQLFLANYRTPSLPELAGLTVREHQIVGLMAQGLTNKEIGARLNITAHTVKTHVHNILPKLGCRRRVDIFGAHCATHKTGLQSGTPAGVGPSNGANATQMAPTEARPTLLSRGSDVATPKGIAANPIGFTPRRASSL